jgi:MFS family permease
MFHSTISTRDRRLPPVRLAQPSLARWVSLCAVAETVGMTAAALAAKVAQAVTGDDPSGSAAIVALSVVVAGGLVEGTALGLAQSAGFSDWLPGRRRIHWLLVTLAVAGLGWAAASLPSVFARNGGAEPPLLLVLAGAVALGVAMGAVLGTAQALVLRGLVPHPWRWVSANALGWAVAMPVIFGGATMPSADWSVLSVVALGALTGALAGAVLGLVSGWFLPSLTGQSVHSPVFLAVLTSPAHRLLGGSMVGLRLRGAKSGALFTLPVMYAEDAGGLVVLPGRPEKKRWWRNLRRPADVSVLVDGHWRPGMGSVLEPGDAGYDQSLAAYRRRWPRIAVGTGPLVRIDW